MRQIVGNVLFNADGTVWAAYRADLTDGGYPTASRLRELLASTEAVLKNLPSGEVMIASLCRQVDAAEVVRAMIDGVDLRSRPQWVETAEAVLDQLEELEMSSRTHWLLVSLTEHRATALARASLRTATDDMLARLGLAAGPVREAEVAAARVKADDLLGSLPGGVGLRPAIEAELLWWIARSPRRGLDEPVLRPTSTENAHAARRSVGHRVSLEDVILDEGGKTDDTHIPSGDGSGLSQRLGVARRAVLGPAAALRRRYVKVITEDGESYQAFLVVAQMPSSIVFPHAQWLRRVDDFGFPVDWVARCRIVPNETARSKNRKQARELSAQWEEHSDELGPPAELGEAVAELDEQGERLAASATEVEVQATAVFCVWGGTPQVANARAEALRKTYGSNEFALARPLGHQTQLYLAMLPGAPAPPVIADYTQFLLARDFAMAMPWLGTDVGDPVGGLLGFGLDGNGVRPVLYDPSYGPRIGSSASAAVCAELGGGKSVWLKKIWFEARARLNGRVIAVDRTPMREYVVFSHTCPGTTQVIDVSEAATVSLDPLRIFTGKVAIRHAEAFYSRWLDLSPRSPQGLVLAEAIESVAASGTPSSTRLVGELERRAGKDAVARDLARQLRLMARRDLARMVFDDTLPALDVASADSIVFATATIPMPTRDELASDYRTTRLAFAKAFGRAVHVLIAAISREVAFADARFAAVIWDECYSVTCSEEGEQLILETVRDGRKHNAGAFLGGHDAETDFGSTTLRGLIPVRLLGRHRDATLARRGLAWMDLDDSPELVELVTTDLSPLDLQPELAETRRGEFLYRDTRRRVGRIKVLIPPYRDVPEAILTNPHTPPTEAKQ